MEGNKKSESSDAKLKTELINPGNITLGLKVKRREDFQRMNMEIKIFILMQEW